MRLLWPGNSLDLNMIEPCWPWLKRETCKTGAPKTREEMEKKWREEWENFPQNMLQEFVAWDNKYREGRIDGKSDTKRGKQLLAQLEADMAEAEAFESLQPEQIPPYSEDSSGVSSTSSEDEDDNIESIIEDSEEDVQEQISHEQRRSSLYVTPEPPTPEPLTPIKRDTYNKNRKLRRPTLYNTPEPPTPEPLTPLKDRITIFLQTPMKEVIPSPELGFIKRKTRRTKVAVVKTAASMRHKRLR